MTGVFTVKNRTLTYFIAFKEQMPNKAYTVYKTQSKYASKTCVFAHILRPMRNDPNRFHFSNLADNLTTGHIFPLRRKKALELYGFTMRNLVTPGQLSTVKLFDCRVGKRLQNAGYFLVQCVDVLSSPLTNRKKLLKVEQPNTYKYLVFLGIHHLTVSDLGEINSISK